MSQPDADLDRALIMPAPSWRRAAARGLDLLAATLGWALLALVGALDLRPLQPEAGWFWSEWIARFLLDEPMAIGHLLLAALTLLWLWHAAWGLLTGRTPGKMALGLHVLSTQTGDQLSPRRHTQRALLSALALPTLGLSAWWAHASRTGQAWHDLLSGAIVTADTPSRQPD